ncbi:hypothetical protein YC2023_008939 [Brassica napus]
MTLLITGSQTADHQRLRLQRKGDGEFVGVNDFNEYNRFIEHLKIKTLKEGKQEMEMKRQSR